jgi:hypothetical protein
MTRRLSARRPNLNATFVVAVEYLVAEDGAPPVGQCNGIACIENKFSSL